MNNTVFYIVVTVIIIHFVIGIVFLVRKLGGPVSEEPLDDATTQADANDITTEQSE